VPTLKKGNSQVQTFIFTCTIADRTDFDLDLADAIYAAGADDSSVGSRDGVVTVDFDREAETLDQAVRTAIDDLAKAGLRVSVVRIDANSLKAIEAA